MRTVKELGQLVGVSVRTLHHYDAIGLLKPTKITDAGYRLYDDKAVDRLRRIIVYKELGFSLKEIAFLLNSPQDEQTKTLDAKIRKMEQQRNTLQNHIFLAKQIEKYGVKTMDFEYCSTETLQDHETQAKLLWGKTEAYREYEQHAAGRSAQENKDVNGRVMEFFVRLGELRDHEPDSEAVQMWVSELRAYFTEHFYNCTPQILLGLGEMYVSGGSMTENIDRAGGEGTARLAREAIQCYCKMI